jgi:hypothetical protein
MAVKIHHAEKTLQLFDFLRGWAEFDFSGVVGRGGRPCCRKCVANNLQRRCCKDTFFKVYGKTIGGQSRGKASRWPVLCIRIQPDPKLVAS